MHAGEVPCSTACSLSHCASSLVATSGQPEEAPGPAVSPKATPKQCSMRLAPADE
jgi:hypothetical protein